MRGVPAQGERCLVCSPVAVQGELTLGSSNDLSLVKDLIAGDHQHAATLPSRQSAKKAPLGCHIYGMKWLARSQIAYNGRSTHGTPCTYNVHCVALLLCGFPGGVLGPATAHAFTSFGACTTLLLVWLRGCRVHPSH